MITPTKDYILIKVDKQEEKKTDSGIYLPEKTDTTTNCGTVAQDNLMIDNYILSRGSVVYFKRFAGEEIRIDSEDYLLVHVKDVIAFKGGE